MYITYQVSNLQFIYMYMDKQYIYNDLLVSASEIGREVSLSGMICSEYQYILFLLTTYVYYA